MYDEAGWANAHHRIHELTSAYTYLNDHWRNKNEFIQ